MTEATPPSDALAGLNASDDEPDDPDAGITFTRASALGGGAGRRSGSANSSPSCRAAAAWRGRRGRSA
ncbi:hypothetical protein [Sphingomonas sp.]|uniref:hypothetical protein n=1 Tax=Sphingomonas sp. TaxID=28214 RepID=UPI00286CFDD6|nr:hypothetical protein [Sphingomonas sp.]